MNEIVVVGGGIAGLLAVDHLLSLGRNVVGFERGESLGADLSSGHHRFYDSSARSFFEAAGFSFDWSDVEEEPIELKKGKTIAPEVEDITPGQRFFLGKKFAIPAKGFSELLAALVGKVGNKFQLKRAVQEVDLEKRVLRFLDGSEEKYGTLVWCQSLESLVKAAKGALSDNLIKGKKKQDVEEGGLILDMEFRSPFAENANTIVLPFRFKDDVHKALGNRDNFAGENVRFSWTIFLDEMLLENREEVAKCVKTFKREFFKQFPTAQEAFVRERIVFLPLISSGTSTEAKKLELFDGVFYLGSEVHLKSGNAELQNLDLLLENCRFWSEELRSASGELAAGSLELPTESGSPEVTG